MNSKPEKFLEAAGVRVRFLWRGDRWAHEILLAEAGEWASVLSSVEGSPDDDWPASPPLQSLEIEDSPAGGKTALLVGMAGHSHWSASVEIDRDAPAVHFDVACRVPAAEVGPLGSTYTASGATEIELDGRFSPLHLESQAGSVRIAVGLPSDTAVRTIRWAYRIDLLSR